MAIDNPRVWFKSISLENVRSFGKRQTVYFTEDGTENGKAARWNVILGDNGTGKTTALKGLALTASAKFGNNRFAYSKEHFYSLKRWGSTITVVIHAEVEQIDKQGVCNKLISFASAEFGDNLILPPTEVNGKTVNVYDKRDEKMFVGAYGASRRISEGALTEERNAYYSLFSEDIALVNAEEWLVQAEYISLKNEQFVNRYRSVLDVIRRLFSSETYDVYVNVQSSVPKVFFKTPYGDVRLHELSLGYKTLIAWVVDFANGLFDEYPDSKNPLAEPAVCLVDEIDLHLHPKFQRNIIQFLTDTFPNTQFIVTAHSPLIVVAAEERPLDANIILLKREGDQTVVVNDPVDVSKWSVDQILNSDLFGYVPPVSEPLTELRLERDVLLTKAKLSKKEQARLTELDEKIGFVPFGRDQTEIRAETIIQQLADVLRSKQSV
jgi:hypothetical protein